MSNPIRCLISGCSFSYYQNSWSELLKNNYHNIDTNNISMPGAGNKYIADSVILTGVDNYDLVIVMWSGLTRLDVPVERSEIFNNYYFKRTVNNSTYLYSGGIIGSWLSNSITKMVFDGQYKMSSNLDLIKLSLLEMIKLQGYLKSKNKKYIFTSYVNYWNKPKDWISSNGDVGLNNIDGIDHLINQIDFDNWLFLNDNKDGIYEFALQHDFFIEDKFHPSTSAYEFWAELTYNRIKELTNVNQ